MKSPFDGGYTEDHNPMCLEGAAIQDEGPDGTCRHTGFWSGNFMVEHDDGVSLNASDDLPWTEI